jgi:hypothetical protein
MRTRNSGATYEPNRYPALCAWWMWNVAHFDTRRISCNDCALSFWCPRAKFSHLSYRAPGICAALFYIITTFMYVPGRTMFLFAIKCMRRFPDYVYQISGVDTPDRKYLCVCICVAASATPLTPDPKLLSDTTNNKSLLRSSIFGDPLRTQGHMTHPDSTRRTPPPPPPRCKINCL